MFTKLYAESAFMKKWITKINAAILLSCSLPAFSQNIPLESWRPHFSYHNVRQLIAGNDKIFASAENGLFYVNVNSKEVNILSKTDGLSDVNISAMVYDEGTKTLILGYESGLIDLYANGKVRTIRDLRDSPLAGNKRINDISSDGTNAYLGTSFGVIVVSLTQKEVTDNYRSIGSGGEDLTILELEVFENQLIVISDRLIQVGRLEKNLLDFNNWSRYSTTNQSIRSLTAGDRLYAIENDTSLVQVGNMSVESIPFPNSRSIEAIAYDESLFVLVDKNLFDMSISTVSPILSFGEDYSPSSIIANEGVWVGTKRSGLLSPSLEVLMPNGPISDTKSNVRFTNGKIFSFYSQQPELFTGEIDSSGYDTFDNISWSTQKIENFFNISDAAFFDGHMLYSSIGFGVYDELLNDTVPQLNKTNDGQIIIPTMESLSGQLYIPSYDNDLPLNILDDEGVISSYSENDISTRNPVGLKVSRFGSLWIQRSSFEGGLVAVNLEDEELRIINGSDGLASSNINNYIIDLEDETWVATTSGISIFSDASFPFNSFNAIQPIFENQELFEGEEIYAVGFDGGNRIWMSTREGLHIFNNSLSELEKLFTVDNSPLPSHRVLNLAYNSNNGEMFISTDRGMVSYRSSSSLSQSISQNALMYPNPVHPGYSGLVGLSNLGANTQVKITDQNGKLIKSLNVNGGTASWDLLDYNGSKVPSSIYLFFISSINGEDTLVGKLAVVN